MYSIYLLISLNREWKYVGLTDDPCRRLNEHNSGHTKSTKPYAPFRMIILRTHAILDEARKSEKYFKSGYGRKHIKRILAKEVELGKTITSAEDLGFS